MEDGGPRTHLVHLGMVKHLGLCRAQVLHGVGVQGTWLHAAHEGSGIHLRAWAGDPHMPDELVRHAARGRAGLARVVRHTRSHRMTRGGTGMLWHGAGVRRKAAWRHTGHHLRERPIIHQVEIDLRSSPLSHAKLNGGRGFSQRMAVCWCRDGERAPGEWSRTESVATVACEFDCRSRRPQRDNRAEKSAAQRDCKRSDAQ